MKELQKDGRPYRTAYEAEQSAIRAYTNGILRGTDPLVAQGREHIPSEAAESGRAERRDRADKVSRSTSRQTHRMAR